MTDVEEHLHDVLLAIVRAHREMTPEGVRESLMFIRHFGGGGIKHRGWPDDGPAVGEDDLEELAERGFLRLDYREHSTGVSPTSLAYEAVADYDRRLARAERGGVLDLSWPRVEPVLRTVTDLWEREGGQGHLTGAALAAELGREADDVELGTVLDLLATRGWVETTYRADEALPAVRPTAEALTGLRDWPGADSAAVFERVLKALDDLAENAATEEDRQKLSRAREFLIDLSSATIAAIAGQVAGGEL